MEEILTDPAICFNSDETFFLISPGKEKVLAPTVTKNVNLVNKSSVKSGVFVLATISSSGWIFLLSSSIHTNGLNDGLIRKYLPESNLSLQKSVDDSRCFLFPSFYLSMAIVVTSTHEFLILLRKRHCFDLLSTQYHSHIAAV